MPIVLDALPELLLEPVCELRAYRKVPVARCVRFHQIIVTGPPGAGKSTFIRQLGGWPEEGYVDLALKWWWRAQALAVRPREVHLALPFHDRPRALTLFDEDWSAHWRNLRLDEARIRMPPRPRHLLSVNCLARFVFEFLLPAPEQILADRRQRARVGTHPVDARIELDQIREQVRLFGRVAQHFHAAGMEVYVRERVLNRPARVVGWAGKT